MTNGEILEQIAFWGNEFYKNIERQVAACEPLEGVKEHGTCCCCIVPCGLSVKYQTLDPKFFSSRSQIDAVQKIITRHRTDLPQMLDAIEKMTRTKKAGDVRLNPNMLNILYEILADVRKQV